jgi:ribosomal protein L37AE/L43A
MNTQKQVITEEAAKAKARALCAALAELGVVSDLKPRKALEVVARLENEKNWSTLNARQKAQAGTKAKAPPVRQEYCCGVCDGTRVIEDAQGDVWPCHQCLPSVGLDAAKAGELPDSDRLTQPYLRGTKLLSLAQTAALWQRMQAISCADEGPLTLDDSFLHFRVGDYLEDAEQWLVAMCAHGQFSLEKARNGEYMEHVAARRCGKSDATAFLLPLARGSLRQGQVRV